MDTYSRLIKEHTRLAGVLLHPTSLPSGKLDKDAFRWINFMAEAGLCVWQVLPLGVPQQNRSPYQCYSAFAMNQDLLDKAEYQYSNVGQSSFKQWCEKEQHWLDDYALFMVLKQEFEQHAWYDWPDKYKNRHKEALEGFQQTQQEAIDTIRWQQFCLYQRWYELRQHAKENGILLFGDMPIFIAHDSADVWVHRQSFRLDDDGSPSVVAGVPPDYFSETGQRWGNPHYNWQSMQKDGFDWWLKRLHNHLELFDLVRIDHFRGLEAVWVIPSSCETAIDGTWEKVAGDKLLQRLHEEMGDIPIVAEDLGIITDEVNALRKKYHLPGMSVLQFAFDQFSDNPHKPENITYDRIVYTGTHDNDTTTGWFNSLDQSTQQFVMEKLNIHEPDTVCDAVIDSALKSEGRLAIIPLQDLLHLDSQARINIPGISENNWTWQFHWQDIPENLAVETRRRLKESSRLIKASS